MQTDQDILTLYYKELPFSVGLKRFMNMQGFDTLEKILHHSYSELLKMRGFNARTMKELYQFLEDNGLEKLLKTS